MNAKAVALMAGGLIAVAGVGTAVGDLGDDDERKGLMTELEIRKDDSSDDVELVDEDDDRGDPGDGSRDAGCGDDGRSPAQQDPSPAQQDGTAGDDDTEGGDNSYVAPAADDYAAPAPAPAPAYYDDDGGSDDGGSDG